MGKFRKGIVGAIGLFAIITILASGGPQYRYQSGQINESIVDGRVDISLQALCYNVCESLLLTITNNTDKDIELDWNKTLYISGGKTNGGFMFEGVIYKDRNNRKPPDIIFPGQEFSKKIWPNNLVNYVSGQYGGWRHRVIRGGEVGAYVTLLINRKEINKTLVVNVAKKKI